MMTLKEFEEFVRNRPKPDTPGVYKLIIYKWHKHDFQGDWKYGAMTRTVKSTDEYTGEDKEVTGLCWRFPFTDYHDNPDYEYHPTFEDAHAAMMEKVGGEDIYGFRINRLGYGPLGNHDWYVEYWSFDAAGCQFDHSSCSSYHYMQPSIYGRFLGRFPEEIPFKAGDIVQIVTSLFGEHHDYATLGVVIATPHSVEDSWEWYCSQMEEGVTEHEFFEGANKAGADDDEYFILFGPYDYELHNTSFRMAVEVRPPAYPVPDDVRETLMKYYQDYNDYREREYERNKEGDEEKDEEEST